MKVAMLLGIAGRMLIRFCIIVELILPSDGSQFLDGQENSGDDKQERTLCQHLDVAGLMGP